MKWKFWENNEKSPETGKVRMDKSQKPRELPSHVGRHMVVKLQLDPDWVWTLRCVSQKRPESPGAFDIRIFDPRMAMDAGVKVLNYASLDDHPALILYSGGYLATGDQVNLDKAA